MKFFIFIAKDTKLL